MTGQPTDIPDDYTPPTPRRLFICADIIEQVAGRVEKRGNQNNHEIAWLRSVASELRGEKRRPRGAAQ